jgi:hypothetical protein
MIMVSAAMIGLVYQGLPVTRIPAGMVLNNNNQKPMKIITNHFFWWILLIAATAAVSAVTSYQITPGGMISSMAGHLIFAVGVALVPWIVYRIFGKPMTTEEMMATITAGWLILAVANLSV